MKNFYRTSIAVALLAMLGACSTTPTTTSLLESTRSEFSQAQNSPQVNKYASVELAQAKAAMDQTNEAAKRRENSDKVDNLAYQTKQKVALAQEVTKKKQAEADVAMAGKERDSIRLEQRTNEADQANANAQQAQMATKIAQEETAQAQARTAELEAQLADLAAKKTERGIVITLGDVLFGSNKSALNPDGMRSAQKLADVLKKNTMRTVLVEGYTDSTGSAAYNQDLSARRASSVRDALLQMGIASDRISVRGYGESYPVAGNETDANRQLNRRVEIVLSDDSGKTKPRG